MRLGLIKLHRRPDLVFHIQLPRPDTDFRCLSLATPRVAPSNQFSSRSAGIGTGFLAASIRTPSQPSCARCCLQGIVSEQGRQPCWLPPRKRTERATLPREGQLRVGVPNWTGLVPGSDELL